MATFQPVGMGAGQALKGVVLLQKRVQRIAEGHSRRLRIGIDRDEDARLIQALHRKVLEHRPVQEPEAELPQVADALERAGMHCHE